MQAFANEHGARSPGRTTRRWLACVPPRVKGTIPIPKVDLPVHESYIYVRENPTRWGGVLRISTEDVLSRTGLGRLL